MTSHEEIVTAILVGMLTDLLSRELIDTPISAVLGAIVLVASLVLVRRYGKKSLPFKELAFRVSKKKRSNIKNSQHNTKSVNANERTRRPLSAHKPLTKKTRRNRRYKKIEMTKSMEKLKEFAEFLIRRNK